MNGHIFGIALIFRPNVRLLKTIRVASRLDFRITTFAGLNIWI